MSDKEFFVKFLSLVIPFFIIFSIILFLILSKLGFDLNILLISNFR